jgi:hypothetical protein
MYLGPTPVGGQRPRCPYCYQRFNPYARNAWRHLNGTCAPQPGWHDHLSREVIGCAVVLVLVLLLLAHH